MSQTRGNQTKKLVFSAAAIALATVISVAVKLPSLPNGGSVTLFSMLFVCLIGYWYGPRTGLTAAVAYGILQFITEPYVVHPLQVILDYPVAYGLLGLSGFFSSSRNGLVKGYIAGVLGRFAGHMVSGLIFYTAYVGSLKGNLTAMWTATVYNMSYIFPEAIITLILLAVPAVRKGLENVKRMALE